ncbi:MAG: class I SAM-dependent methyltransferase [Deltaproteobacteria bacterium]|nr:class I SAM-dependent methyltransferase [Deltaproteobacteria bacterium]
MSPCQVSNENIASPLPLIHWTEAGKNCSALWRSERGAPPPKRVALADDGTTADAAYRLACEGTALLWRGDFHNAKLLLQALVRRIDKTPARKQRKTSKQSTDALSPAEMFHHHRLAQSQRARLLGSLLIPFNPDYSIALRRAPDARQACAEAWGAANEALGDSLASLRDLLGMISASEWRKNGVEIAELGAAPNHCIHPHYGVFSPLRGEYVSLVATAPIPRTGQEPFIAFDIGTGTGVLAAVLVRRHIEKIIATDRDPRALACARENFARLGVTNHVQVEHANLFPDGRASLILCNPPWLPARPSSPIDANVYDEDSRMLLGFLNGVLAHLVPNGEAWLILSDLAEHLGLRSRGELLAAFATAGLKVVGRSDIKPRHPKAADINDPLHFARAAEVTSLWRLTANEP